MGRGSGRGGRGVRPGGRDGGLGAIVRLGEERVLCLAAGWDDEKAVKVLSRRPKPRLSDGALMTAWHPFTNAKRSLKIEGWVWGVTLGRFWAQPGLV